MKKIIILILCIFQVSPILAQKTYEIKGRFTSIKAATITLAYKDQQGVEDSVHTTDGSFSFSGTVSRPVKGMLMVKTLQPGAYPGFSLEYVELYVEPGKTSVNGPAPATATINGGEAQADFNLLNQQLKPAKVKMDQLLAKYNKATAERDSLALHAIMDQATVINNERSKLEEDFISAHPASYVSWDLLKQHSTIIDPVTFEPLFSKMAKQFRESEEGREMAEQLALSRKTAVGQQAMDFEQMDVNGKKVTLSSLKGRYVLLDFWASWCGPCRAENPNVLKAYNKFKDKHLEILAVSLDQNKANWLSAIEKDAMPWIHVSDLKGWKNEVAAQYGIRSIPQNLLIGPDGRIIAKNLRGSALEKKLSEILE
ncbi:Peroxiredoxin [Chitinophaga terrae (ex Kim and Jung 2007)]|uniref:Peroxiredoxin n=1 Tax=Chitinophaga terrae (ex Kim and Jung 2007) TaxID=408074 RepID=A0A1H3WS32_9BACT|nr:TlpA disulfide reductase family protein [Chitinophaga terrae (ex Kim and Jung 2007)]GEP90807.1 thiol:disulfide interchange protein [Chitinophaga terrae (ex Kim and Jung 2007)]SDZ89966.1 Peroxiredoxin [Chitinophaga terrae (ex Kim and Jung 2007)]